MNATARTLTAASAIAVVPDLSRASAITAHFMPHAGDTPGTPAPSSDRESER